MSSWLHSSRLEVRRYLEALHDEHTFTTSQAALHDGHIFMSPTQSPKSSMVPHMELGRGYKHTHSRAGPDERTYSWQASGIAIQMSIVFSAAVLNPLHPPRVIHWVSQTKSIQRFGRNVCGQNVCGDPTSLRVSKVIRPFPCSIHI